MIFIIYFTTLSPGAKSYTCLTPAMGSLLESTPTVEAHLIVDNHRIRLEPFVVHEDPVMESINNTQTGRFNERGRFMDLISFV